MLYEDGSDSDHILRFSFFFFVCSVFFPTHRESPKPLKIRCRCELAILESVKVAPYHEETSILSLEENIFYHANAEDFLGTYSRSEMYPAYCRHTDVLDTNSNSVIF